LTNAVQRALDEKSNPLWHMELLQMPDEHLDAPFGLGHELPSETTLVHTFGVTLVLQ
jgi:hypothetical protein